MHRGFVRFNNDGPRLSHTIGVGTPGGINYIYDLSSANLVACWRGNFADATPMWHNRGDGSFLPNGSAQWTFLNQSVAELPNQNSSFPETGESSNFIPLGYKIDEATSLPIFMHRYKGMEIENQLTPDPTSTYLINEIRFSGKGMTNWYLKIAQGDVRKMQDGSYAVNDQQYFVNILSGQMPQIREIGGETELILPVDGSSIRYEIIW